jgi:hypothetical protein
MTPERQPAPGNLPPRAANEEKTMTIKYRGEYGKTGAVKLTVTLPSYLIDRSAMLKRRGL